LKTWPVSVRIPWVFLSIALAADCVRWSKKFEVRALYTKRPLDKTEAMPISGVRSPVIITRHP
ncbi:hypothetical protein, partial [Mesorhizobium sp. M7A.F.Ca.AU.001.01.1.1]|uniref:hypothetical protein n=1 Tax=Mesorhizobium sp. M7A.F.Ca.AU.001.01.1.1 TaxID=2496675 RepID=UPI0019D4DD3B